MRYEGQSSNDRFEQIARELTRPPMYPHVEARIDLEGPGGNVFSVIGNVVLSLRRAGMSEEASVFTQSAVEQDSYESVLRLALETVGVCTPDRDSIDGWSCIN